MKHVYSFIFLICFYFVSFAGGENLIAGANHSAMGGTNATAQNVFSAHNNPAGMSFVKRVSFGLYTDIPYLVKGVNNFNLSSVIPVQNVGAFGVDINYMGFSAYNETRAGISYARKFGDIVSVGVKFDYLRLAIADNGSKNLFAFGVGLQYQPFEVFRVGASIYNPVSMKLDADYEEKLATTFTLGIAYLPSKKLSILVDAEKELDEKIRLKAGIEYNPLKPLFLRIGAATNPTLITFGLGTAFKNFKLDVSASWHLELGVTPQISLVYNITKKKKSEGK
jgi:long-subunit fatty acid transport protein